MTTQLHQIIAVEQGVRSRAKRDLTDAYHTIQQAPRFSGISRQYQPKDEDGETLPSESQLPQVTADQVLQDAARGLTRLFDVTLTKDVANQEAKADLVVDGTTIATGVPVTYLLWLEKQLTDVRTLVSKVPTLAPEYKWAHDPAIGAWATDVIATTRTKKVPRNHVLAEATDKHPAQVQMFHEDVIVGTWNTIRYSGALPADRVRALLERVDGLIEAVKLAREAANNLEVTDRKIGDQIFDYLLAE